VLARITSEYINCEAALAFMLVSLTLDGADKNTIRAQSHSMSQTKFTKAADDVDKVARPITWKQPGTLQ
jgi:hypothetical protein